MTGCGLDISDNTGHSHQSDYPFPQGLCSQYHVKRIAPADDPTIGGRLNFAADAILENRFSAKS